MPYENWVAVSLVFLVLLVPLLKWAKDWWMSEVFHLTVDTDAGGKKISGSTLEALMVDLAGKLSCTSASALETLRLDPTIRGQLEGQGAWGVLVEFLDVSVDSFARTAARRGNWSAVKALLSQCSGTAQREIAELISGTQCEDEAREQLLSDVIDLLVVIGRLENTSWIALLGRLKRSGYANVVAGTRTRLAKLIIGISKNREPERGGH